MNSVSNVILFLRFGFRNRERNREEQLTCFRHQSWDNFANLLLTLCVAKPVMFYHWKQLKYARDKKSSFQISFANKIQHHTTQEFNPNVCRAFCHSLSDVLFRCANKTRANPVCESVANSAKCWCLRITNNLKSSFIIITLTS